MDSDNPLLEKTISFAIRIVKCYQYLQNEKKGVRNVQTVITMRHKYWGKRS